MLAIPFKLTRVASRKTASRCVRSALLSQQALQGHGIAALRALKSSLSATAGGKGPEIRPKMNLAGVPVAGLGANMVPMEIMEGRYAAGMHRQIVQSAADGGMSLLRVWGGGIYPCEEWFDACDELGALLGC